MSLHARVALFFYVMLGLTLKNTYGFFQPIGLIVLTLAFIPFCWIALRNRERDAGEQFPTSAAVLSALLAFQAFLLWHGSIRPEENPAGLVHPQKGDWLHLLRAEYGPLALFLAAAVLQWFVVVAGRRPTNWDYYVYVMVRTRIVGLPISASGRRLETWRFYVCVALLLGILGWQRVAVLKVSPDPQIDTLVVNRQACDYLIAGVNPYGADVQYEDIYRGGYDYRAGFPYWPVYLYWTAPFRYFFDDIRYGSVVADFVTAILLWAIARRLKLDTKTACLVPLIWLSFPVSLHVLEQAWIDPVLVMAVTVLLWTLVARKWALVGLALGLVCGVKQYGLLVAAFTILYMLRHERQHIVRTLVCMAIALTVIFVPFLVLDAQSFYQRTVGVYLNPTLRSDALSWPAAAKKIWLSEYAKQKGLHDRLSVLQPPEWLLPALYLAVVTCGSLRIVLSKRPELKLWAAVLPFSLGVIFLFGKIAFCNYYYFVAFLVLVYLMLCLRPEGTDDEATKTFAPAVS